MMRIEAATLLSGVTDSSASYSEAISELESNIYKQTNSNLFQQSIQNKVTSPAILHEPQLATLLGVAQSLKTGPTNFNMDQASWGSTAQDAFINRMVTQYTSLTGDQTLVDTLDSTSPDNIRDYTNQAQALTKGLAQEQRNLAILNRELAIKQNMLATEEKRAVFISKNSDLATRIQFLIQQAADQRFNIGVANTNLKNVANEISGFAQETEDKQLETLMKQYRIYEQNADTNSQQLTLKEMSNAISKTVSANQSKIELISKIAGEVQRDTQQAVAISNRLKDEDQKVEGLFKILGIVLPAQALDFNADKLKTRINEYQNNLKLYQDQLLVVGTLHHQFRELYNEAKTKKKQLDVDRNEYYKIISDAVFNTSAIENTQVKETIKEMKETGAKLVNEGKFKEVNTLMEKAYQSIQDYVLVSGSDKEQLQAYYQEVRSGVIQTEKISKDIDIANDKIANVYRQFQELKGSLEGQGVPITAIKSIEDFKQLNNLSLVMDGIKDAREKTIKLGETLSAEMIDTRVKYTSLKSSISDVDRAKNELSNLNLQFAVAEREAQQLVPNTSATSLLTIERRLEIALEQSKDLTINKRQELITLKEKINEAQRALRENQTIEDELQLGVLTESALQQRIKLQNLTRQQLALALNSDLPNSEILRGARDQLAMNIPGIEQLGSMEDIVTKTTEIYRDALNNINSSFSSQLKTQIPILFGDSQAEPFSQVWSNAKTALAKLNHIAQHDKNPVFKELSKEYQDYYNEVIQHYFGNALFLFSGRDKYTGNELRDKVYATQQQGALTALQNDAKILDTFKAVTNNLFEMHRKSQVLFNTIPEAMENRYLSQLNDAQSGINFEVNKATLVNQLKDAVVLSAKSNEEGVNTMGQLATLTNALTKSSESLLTNFSKFTNREELAESQSLFGGQIKQLLNNIMARDPARPDQVVLTDSVALQQFTNYLYTQTKRMAANKLVNPSLRSEFNQADQFADALLASGIVSGVEPEEIDKRMTAFFLGADNEVSKRLVQELSQVAGVNLADTFKNISQEQIYNALQNKSQAQRILRKGFAGENAKQLVLDYVVDTKYLYDELKDNYDQQKDKFNRLLEEDNGREQIKLEAPKKLLENAYGGSDNVKSFFKGPIMLSSADSKNLGLMGQASLLAFGDVKKRILTSSIQNAQQIRENIRKEKEVVNRDTTNIVNINKELLNPTDDKDLMASTAGIFSFYMNYIRPNKQQEEPEFGFENISNKKLVFDDSSRDTLKALDNNQKESLTMEMIQAMPDIVASINSLTEAKMKAGNPILKTDVITLLAFENTLDQLNGYNTEIIQSQEYDKVIVTARRAVKEEIDRVKQYQQEFVRTNNDFLASVDNLIEQRITQTTDFDNYKKINMKVQEYQDKQQSFIENNINRMGLQSIYRSDPQMQQLARTQTMPQVVQPSMMGGNAMASRPFVAMQNSSAQQTQNPQTSRIDDVILDKAGVSKVISADDIAFIKTVRFDPASKQLSKESATGDGAVKTPLTDIEKKRFLRLTILVYLSLFSSSVRNLSRQQKEEAQNRMQIIYKNPEKVELLFKIVNKLSDRVNSKQQQQQ